VCSTVPISGAEAISDAEGIAELRGLGRIAEELTWRVDGVGEVRDALRHKKGGGLPWWWRQLQRDGQEPVGKNDSSFVRLLHMLDYHNKQFVEGLSGVLATATWLGLCCT